MVYSYYPGCTLKTKAKDLDRYARLSAEKLGAPLCELEEWQCCGGAFTTASDEIATKLASVRALAAAKEKGSVLVTVCSACHNVLKQTNKAIRENSEFASKVTNYMKPENPYSGETRVIHYLELLRDEIGFDKLSEAVTNPLTGRRIAAYYGCLLLRPSSALAMDDPENPTIIEDFIKALGAEPVIYPMRNECCGGYITLEDKASAEKKSSAVMRSCAEFGADTVITACPLCLYNLKKNSGADIPVVYFTELLAEALGIKDGGNT